MERGIFRVGRTSEGLQSGCSGRPWAPPPPQTWPPKRSRGAGEVARARSAVRAASLRSFEPWERREWGVGELLLRCLVSTRASYTQTDSWQSTTTYNEKCSQFMEELSELAYLRQWDNVRALLVKVSRNIDAYLDEDEAREEAGISSREMIFRVFLCENTTFPPDDVAEIRSS